MENLPKSPFEEYNKRKQHNIDSHLKSLPPKMQAELKDFLIQYTDKRKLAVATQESYVRSLSFFGLFLHSHGKNSFKGIKKSDIQAYLTKIKPKSDSIKDWFKASAKVFFRFIETGGLDRKDKYPESVAWITIGTRKFKEILPEEMLTLDEYNAMLAAARYQRDRALFALFVDTGARLSEIINLKIKDVFLTDKPYIRITISKTKERPVYLVHSIGELKLWLDGHPDKDNGDFQNSFVFKPIPRADTNSDKKTKNTANNNFPYITVYNALAIIKRMGNRAKIKKRVWVHGLRHASATFARKQNMPDQFMRIKLGWGKNSKMPDRYSHVNAEDVANFEREKAGLSVQNPELMQPITCQKCKEKNLWNAAYCKCGFPLKPELIAEYESAQLAAQKKQADFEARIDRLEVANETRLRRKLKALKSDK